MTKFQKFSLLAVLAVLVVAFVPSLTDFNSGQFNTSANKVNIASGAPITNLAIYSSAALNTQIMTYGPSGQPVFYIPGFTKPLGNTAYWNWDVTASAWTFTSIIQWTNSAWTASALLGTDASKAGPIGVALGAGLSLSSGTVNVTGTLTNSVATTGTLDAGSGVFTNNLTLGTNSWAGPTNTLDLSNGEQWYATVTPMSITGILNKLSKQASSVVLAITNGATTNVTFTLTAFVSDDGARSYTVTNASMRIFSFRYEPVWGTTSVVSRPLY